jgi:diguanylate cyclase (GGDEF)-like protein
MGRGLVLIAITGQYDRASRREGVSPPSAILGDPSAQVQPEKLVLLFALVIAVTLVALIALQLPRLGRRLSRAPGAGDAYAGTYSGTALDSHPDPNSPAGRQILSGAGGLPAGLYQRMTRVVSFMFIGSAVAIVALTGTANAGAIYLLLAFGLILIELFQDVLPAAALGRWRIPLEAFVVLIFLTVLISMTGGHQSPYFFGYILLVGAAALSTSDIGAAILAVVCSLAYIGAVALGSGSEPLSTGDFGVVAFNLVSISLVMYVASVIGREQRRAREEALRLSRFDSLTTLHSRAYFTSELEQEILRATRTGRPFAIVMLDLDGLKAANDRFGHDWGDSLLKAVADVMRGDIRVTDVAARYGGDEFVLMLPETDLSGAVLVAEKVRVDISRVALPHNGAVVRTSASIGIVTFPDDGRTSAELMRRADLAMYEAKRRGRDQIVRFARTAGTPVAPPGTSRSSYRYPGPSPATGEPPPQTIPPEPIRIPIQPNAPAADQAAGSAFVTTQPGTAAVAQQAAPAVAQQAVPPVSQVAAPPVAQHAVPVAPQAPAVPPASVGPAPWETR